MRRILTPDPVSKELTLSNVHPGVTVGQVRAVTDWELKISSDLQITPAPTVNELLVLRELEQRTALAHQLEFV